MGAGAVLVGLVPTFVLQWKFPKLAPFWLGVVSAASQSVGLFAVPAVLCHVLTLIDS